MTVPGLDIEAWAYWADYRRKSRWPIVCIEAAQKKMAKLGQFQKAAAVYSRSRGYRGLFPPPEVRAIVPGTFNPAEKW